MLNVLVAGYGKMGKMIVETIEQSDDMKVVMIADGTNHPDVSTLQEHVNIIIDFSHPDNLTWIKPFVLEHACAYICGTTGHNDIQKRQVEELSSQGTARERHSRDHGCGVQPRLQCRQQRAIRFLMNKAWRLLQPSTMAASSMPLGIASKDRKSVV